MPDPFQTLGFEPAFELDLAALEQRHRELSRALHPDRFTGRPPSERRQALSLAIEVNEAFRRLRDPVRRAEALLDRLGIAQEEGQEPKASPAFLMQVMELREGLSEARRSKDRVRLAELVTEVSRLESAAKAELAALFRAPARDGAAVAVKLGELRYYRRFLEEAGLVEDEIA